MARRPSALSTQQSTYVDGVMTGKSRNKAALDAGYPNSSAPDISERVRLEIAQAREKLTDLTQIKRVDVIDGIMDGIACARMQGDAGNMIKGFLYAFACNAVTKANSAKSKTPTKELTSWLL